MELLCYKMAKFENGLAGYKSWKGEKNGGWTDEYGLLEGIAVLV